MHGNINARVAANFERAINSFFSDEIFSDDFPDFVNSRHLPESCHIPRHFQVSPTTSGHPVEMWTQFKAMAVLRTCQVVRAASCRQTVGDDLGEKSDIYNCLDHRRVPSSYKFVDAVQGDGSTADLRGRPGRLLPSASGGGSGRGALRVMSWITY